MVIRSGQLTHEVNRETTGRLRLMFSKHNIRAFLDARCAARAAETFLWYRGQSWSYEDLRRITDGAAAAFARLGLKRGDRVAVLLRNGPDFVFSWLALAKLGVVTAPLHADLTPEEVSQMLRYLEPKVFVREASLDGAAIRLPDGCRVLERTTDLAEVLLSRESLSGVEQPKPDDAADILLTSGTTGKPKGVIQSHRTYVITGEGFADWLKLGERDRLFTCLPLSHINARAYSTMGALAAGASLALEERFSASRFWNWLAESEATEVNAVGAMLQILRNGPPSPADRAHKVRLVYSALAMSEEDHLAFEERFAVRLVVGYGLSESTFGFIHPLEGDRRLHSMGKLRSHPDPQFGNEVRLVEDGKDVPEGEIGEIWLRNAAVFSGYFRDPKATQEALTPDGWLRTGDLARREAGDWHTFVARRKEVIRRRGENLAPAEVEAVVSSHSGVKEVAVVGVSSPLGEEDVAAFVVPAFPGAVTEEALRAHCAARLARFKVPSHWRFLDALPRTSTQRVAKHLLRL
jgi:carnitine-CoA ligase